MVVLFLLGFRPLVCLKSDVRLQKNSDGSYTIVNNGDDEQYEELDSVFVQSDGYFSTGQTMKLWFSFSDTSILEEASAIYPYKADEETGKGKLAEDAVVNISGSRVSITITMLEASDEGYYYLVIDTPDGRKYTKRSFWRFES